jgi:hypothetical protein
MADGAMMTDSGATSPHEESKDLTSRTERGDLPAAIPDDPLGRTRADAGTNQGHLDQSGQGQPDATPAQMSPDAAATSAQDATISPDPEERTVLPAEASSDIATDSVPDKTSRAERGDLPATSQANQSDSGISKEEAAERNRVASPKDGVGFGFGDDKPERGQVERWLSGLGAADKTALQEGTAKLFITARASRAGDADFNQQLSTKRAENLAQDLSKLLEIPPDQIRWQALGEDEARSQGRPDGKDNADDRTASIEIVREGERQPEYKDSPEPKGDVDRGLKSVEEVLLQPLKDTNFEEQSGIAKDVLKTLARDMVKNPAAWEKNLVNAALELARKEGSWMGQKLLRDFSIQDKEVRAQMQGNFVPGAVDALARFAGVEPRLHQNAYFRGDASPLYRLGAEMMESRLEGLSRADQENIRRVERSSDRDSFEKRAQQIMGNLYGSNAVQHWDK